MILGIRVRLSLPASQSLKDKRGVMRSLLTRARQDFNLACCELDLMDMTQAAIIEACTCSNKRVQAERVLRKFLNWIEGAYPLEIVEVDWSGV